MKTLLACNLYNGDKMDLDKVKVFSFSNKDGDK